MIIFLSLFSLLLILIPILINVAFLTLLERKVLSLIQRRRGPNKVSVFGVTQPFADAIKLFIKENTQPYISNFLLYYIIPFLSLFLIFILWNLWNFKVCRFIFSLRILYILLIIRLGVYPLLFSGWASNNKFSIFGALRGIAQTISYEISLALIVFTLFIIVNEIDIQNFIEINNKITYIVLFPLLFLFWFLSCIAETNRTPFDFAEGESELVSGFNTEYRRRRFALIFIAEYARIFFFRILSSIFFFNVLNIYIIYAYITLLAYIWILIRSTYPRFRYDKLMNLAWKTLLPWSLCIIFFFLIVILY